MKVLVFDTETTGLMKPGAVALANQPKIIELGLVVLDNGAVVASGNWLIDPGEKLEGVITKITGIRDADLVGKPSFSAVWPEIESYFAQADVTVAHNHPFDKSMVDNEVARIGEILSCQWPETQICTVQEYIHLFGKRPTLKVLYEFFMGKPLEQTHRAIDDVNALVEVIKASGLLDTLAAEE